MCFKTINKDITTFCRRAESDECTILYLYRVGWLVVVGAFVSQLIVLVMFKIVSMLLICLLFVKVVGR